MPIGAWHGNGRKVGWLSPFLLAAWDPAAEQFQSVCRCMSGFTDAFYTEVGGRGVKDVHSCIPVLDCRAHRSSGTCLLRWWQGLQTTLNPKT